MAKSKKVGTDLLLDARAVYRTELAKGSQAQQLVHIQKLVKELPDINRQDKSGIVSLLC